MVLSHKAKQYLLAALKLFILLAAGAFIYYKIKNPSFDVAAVWQTQLNNDSTTVFVAIIIGLLMALLNWGLEAKKWQLLVNSRFVIPYKTAWKQTYGAFTASIVTPQRVGEYGAKALYYPKEARKTVLWLTFLGNAAQLLITLIFGLVGIVGLVFKYNLEFNPFNAILIGVLILFLAALGYLLREQELIIQGLSINNIIQKIKRLESALKVKVLGLALARYITFGTLFYITIGFLGIWLNLTEALVLIGAYYLLISVTPSLFLFDIVVKGGIGLWLFSLDFTVPETIILAAILFNWLLNFVFTTIIGSYFVLKFKPQGK
jgi:hypothetical protein